MSGQPVQGVVAGWEVWRNNRSGRSAHHPIFEFRTVDGQAVRARAADNRDRVAPGAYRGGEAVELLYLERDPRQVRPARNVSVWPSLSLLACAGTAVVTGLFGLWVTVLPWLPRRRSGLGQAAA
jgi:hypothetical protein